MGLKDIETIFRKMPPVLYIADVVVGTILGLSNVYVILLFSKDKISEIISRYSADSSVFIYALACASSTALLAPFLIASLRGIPSVPRIRCIFQSAIRGIMFGLIATVFTVVIIIGVSGIQSGSLLAVLTAPFIGGVSAIFIDLILLPMIVVSGSIFGIANRCALDWFERK